MAAARTHFDAGLLSLDLPAGWSINAEATGTMQLLGPEDEAFLSLRLVQPAATATTSIDTAAGAVTQVRCELDQWVRLSHRVRPNGPCRMLAGEYHPTAVMSATETPRVAWWRRLLAPPASTAWRFWAVLGERLLVLVSASGEEATLMRRAGELDAIVGSIRLPEHDILVGRAFAEAVMDIARTLHPETSVALVDESRLQFGTRAVTIVGLYRQYLEAPARLAELVREFFDDLTCGDAADDTPREWFAVKDFIMPALVSVEEFAKLPADVASEEWINDLHIVYVLDERGTTRHLTRGDLRRWRLEQDAAHEQAIANLVTRSHDITMEGSRTEGYTMLALSTPEAYNATRVLLPDLHKKLREHLGNTFYAAMPNREFLLAFSTDREDVLARVRQQVASDFAKARNPLSPKLFLVTPDGVAGDPEEAENYSEWLGDKWR